MLCTTENALSYAIIDLSKTKRSWFKYLKLDQI